MKIKVGLAALLIATSPLVAVPPANAGETAQVTGEVECTTPGQYTITWTIDLPIGAEGEVTSAVLSGAASGDVSFTPNPFPFFTGALTGTSTISGDTVGTVTLDVTIEFITKGTFTVDGSASVELDGSCEAPPTTTPTTAAPATTSSTIQAAALTQPRFTG